MLKTHDSYAGSKPGSLEYILTLKVTMTSVVNLQPSLYSFLGGLKVTFITALGTLQRMPTLYVALRHCVSSWPASSSQPRVAQCASALESVITVLSTPRPDIH